MRVKDYQKLSRIQSSCRHINKYGLVLYCPLWHPGLSGTTFYSRDAYMNTCTVTGATYSYLGRTYDGVDDYIDHEYHLSSSQNFTINVWVNATAPTEGKTSSIMSFLTASVRGIGIDIPDNGKAVFIMREAGGTSSSVSSTVSIAGSWHMLTATYNTDTNTMEFFVDGVSMGTRAGKVVLTSSLDRIGSNYVVSGAGEYFGGTIGEVEVYSKTLTQSQITQDYNATKWRYQ